MFLLQHHSGEKVINCWKSTQKHSISLPRLFKLVFQNSEVYNGRSFGKVCAILMPNLKWDLLCPFRTSFLFASPGVGIFPSSLYLRVFCSQGICSSWGYGCSSFFSLYKCHPYPRAEVCPLAPQIQAQIACSASRAGFSRTNLNIHTCEKHKSSYVNGGQILHSIAGDSSANARPKL